MPVVKDKQALDKILRARTNLIISNGFFGHLALYLRLVEVTNPGRCPTAAVDGVNLFYNPKFINSLNERECEFLMAHEVMHCCFQHFARRGHRDPMGWNIAGDYVINLDLQQSGFTLIKGGLIDAKYKGMTTEEVYEQLPRIKMSGGSDDGDGQGGDGQGDAQGNGPQSQDPGGCGGVMDAPGKAGEQEQIANDWETNVRQAVAVARANNAGNIPGSLERMVAELNQPKVSWRELTRRWIDQSLIKERSWSRISRRSTALGSLLPGLVSDRLRHMIFVADISGSISTEMLREMLSEVAGALDEGTADMMTVVYADTEVRHTDEFVPGDIVTAKTFDGGGTDFRDSFEWIAQHAPDASCVVYLTDMMTSDFGEDPGIPTLWAVYLPHERYEQVAERAPFGECVWVSNPWG